MATSGYQLNFNQDFTSISVLDGSDGFRIFSINSCDKVEEIYTSDAEHIVLMERLFNTSLVVMVTAENPNCLQMLHFKKNQKICNCVYPTNILSIRMNRTRLIACLEESIHIHDIRDMKRLYSIENIAPNELGLCSLSLNSHLAFPICSTSGDLRLYNASKLKPGIVIHAHESRLSALNFSPSGQLLATASERGTVIRVFCVKTGQRVQEFRRGVKRCVRIASLVFAVNGQFLCVTSNTETVHIFKIDEKAVMMALEAEALKAANATAEKQPETLSPTSSSAEASGSDVSLSPNSSGWSEYLSKAVSSYLLPTQVSDVLAQDRAFATVVLAQPGIRHICGLTYVQKDLKVLIASEEGFLYIHEFNAEEGGACKLQAVHDLRGALDGVVELSLSENSDKMSPGSSNKEASGSGNVPTINVTAGNATQTASSTTKSSQPTTSKSSSTNASSDAKSKKSTVARCIIQNPDPVPDNSYAGILKGNQKPDPLTADSAKYRKLCDAIDTPSKLFDERQFPPVAIAARD
ncbi:WD repeat domain phosphoinositide-interacting protein 2 isoform X1 [Zeugodacus cucurbitae]|uniref:WD repeat domain phosphoinositide-interacting protein 2 isoform X1 n=1 Tax=Zeugodacus cucurbitae TaxID=28588 RepID=UPI0023D94481|nr:WD repeat domain phosphoinositide-interacting protein 2 isoform X1 [Zeugodacus cucurbitae]XP_054084089.1 WD repeat domain phosphoinositide-interacting protein 2 isoform X1 [Zeugodacus cucurbitae]